MVGEPPNGAAGGTGPGWRAAAKRVPGVRLGVRIVRLVGRGAREQASKLSQRAFRHIGFVRAPTPVVQRRYKPDRGLLERIFCC